MEIESYYTIRRRAISSELSHNEISLIAFRPSVDSFAARILMGFDTGLLSHGFFNLVQRGQQEISTFYFAPILKANNIRFA
jgi:hypothetical protein